MKRFLSLFFVLVLLVSLDPVTLWACACGCGVFDVGTSAMLPTHPGGMAYFEYDYMNQNQNWSGNSKTSNDNNPDKQIRTNFFTAGLLYMRDRKWGYEAELPYTNRYFSTTDANGGQTSFTLSAIGDIRVKGVYTGFSDDMSTGLTFGIKLPSGDYSYPNFDADTEIGTGSTDLLLGGYHMGRLYGVKDWNWFANAQWDEPVFHYAGYLPGSQVDLAVGAYYDRWRIGDVKVAPLAQVIGSNRWRDQGILADPTDSGYQRLLLAPGVELDRGPVHVYGDVGFPVYQFVNGNQLAAKELFKLNVSYDF
jgi:hypothetical protein